MTAGPTRWAFFDETKSLAWPRGLLLSRFCSSDPRLTPTLLESWERSATTQGFPVALVNDGSWK